MKSSIEGKTNCRVDFIAMADIIFASGSENITHFEMSKILDMPCQKKVLIKRMVEVINTACNDELSVDVKRIDILNSFLI